MIENMFDKIKIALRRRRIIKRNAPKGYFFALYTEMFLVFGFIFSFVAFILNIPYVPYYIFFLFLAAVWDMIRYTNLWYEMIQNAKQNEPEENVLLILKDLN